MVGKYGHKDGNVLRQTVWGSRGKPLRADEQGLSYVRICGSLEEN